MRKRLILLNIVFFTCMRIFSENVILAPIVCYSGTNKSEVFEINPNEEFYDELKDCWFGGMLSFEMLKFDGANYVYNVADAERQCSVKDSPYLIYGYIQKNEASWIANLKLYDYNQKKIVKEFFASDEIKKYDRFLDILKRNIVTGLGEVVGSNSSDDLDRRTRPFELILPISGFYWTPVDQIWKDNFLGIAGGNIGIEMFPHLKNNILGTTRFDFSVAMTFTYSYGIGTQNIYPINYHTAAAGISATTYLHFSEYNAIYTGCGAFYEFEILQTVPKYEEEVLLYQNMFGVEAHIGYELTMNEIARTFIQVAADFHPLCDSFIAIKPSIGFKFRLYKGASKYEN